MRNDGEGIGQLRLLSDDTKFLSRPEDGLKAGLIFLQAHTGFASEIEAV
jgi:hypothetical protein